MKLTFRFPNVKKGGAGSGHHGHDGRPGKVGGSVGGSGGGSGNAYDHDSFGYAVPKPFTQQGVRDVMTNVGWQINDAISEDGYVQTLYTRVDDKTTAAIAFTYRSNTTSGIVYVKSAGGIKAYTMPRDYVYPEDRTGNQTQHVTIPRKSVLVEWINNGALTDEKSNFTEIKR